MPQMTTKPLSWFKLNSQVRKSFDEEELRLLGESLKAKQLQPVLAQPDGTLIAGERRVRAARIVGLASLEVKIADEQLSESQIRIWQLTENMLRSDLTGHEKWQGCFELMCMNPSWAMKDLAEHLRLDPSMVTKLLSPSKCIPEVQQALAEGKVGITDCYAMSSLPDKEQAGLLALKLSGASRDAIVQASRQNRKPDAPAVRMSRVKCVLPSGISVLVSGEGVSLDESIDALGDAIREMKRARELGYTAKTFAAAMKDKSKKR